VPPARAAQPKESPKPEGTPSTTAHSPLLSSTSLNKQTNKQTKKFQLPSHNPRFVKNNTILPVLSFALYSSLRNLGIQHPPGARPALQFRFDSNQSTVRFRSSSIFTQPLQPFLFLHHQTPISTITTLSRKAIRRLHLDNRSLHIPIPPRFLLSTVACLDCHP
jgi:hypothetical protein